MTAGACALALSVVLGGGAAPAGASGYWFPTAYWKVDAAGAVWASRSYASPPSVTMAAPVVGMAVRADGGGYWLVAADGGVFAFGDAQFHGSAAGLALHAPVVGVAPTADGGGYWLVAADGGVFAFGDAQFHGSAAGLALHAPVVSVAATADGGGYWLVAADGGVFAFGDATFHGSAAGLALHAPVVGMAPTADGGGYWLDGSDGGIFAFGDARFWGSSPSSPGTVVGPPFPTPDDRGYSLVTESVAGTYGEGFGDVSPCWGSANTGLSGPPPDIVASAEAGAVWNMDPDPACPD